MLKPTQLPLFTELILTEDKTVSPSSAEMGTFKDSKRAPIHNWFKYPAGYSNRFVEDIMNRFNIGSGDWMYDPFSGSGTTLICAKQAGVNAYGVEAHSFVHWVADVKLFWGFDYAALGYDIERLLHESKNFVLSRFEDTYIGEVFPDLVYKCYHPQTLIELYLLREFILNEVGSVSIRELLKLALTDTLRSAAAAGTGWPYISPNKNTGEQPAKNAVNIFSKTLRKMYQDLRTVQNTDKQSEIKNVLGDSRQRQRLEDQQIDLALTSPPYLNNYDYADRTRLETYFWGITHSWKDITDQFRSKLMVAATTQVVRKNFDVNTALSLDVKAVNPNIYEYVQSSVIELSKRRLEKGGKKDYDLMVALYVNDILKVLKETYRVMRHGGHFCLVLGDSAPYGVHLPTEKIFGELGLGVGFSEFRYEEFRTRGGKWKANPQRHTIPLREGVVILRK